MRHVTNLPVLHYSFPYLPRRFSENKIIMKIKCREDAKYFSMETDWMFKPAEMLREVQYSMLPRKHSLEYNKILHDGRLFEKPAAEETFCSRSLQFWNISMQTILTRK